MDLAHIQSIRNKNDDDALVGLLDKLPSGTWPYDALATRLWWVLYNKEKTIEQIIAWKNTDIGPFLMSTLSGNSYVHTKTREREIAKVLKGSWRMLEYIIVDFMNRHCLNYKLPEASSFDDMKFLYTKWTIEQDTQDKVDFLSTTSLRKWEAIKSIVTGMQLTTIDAPKHMKHSEDRQSKEDLFDKKMQIMQKLILPYKDKNLPRSYQPDICGCMIVNGQLQKQVHDVWNVMFQDTFAQWQVQWYPQWWPTQFLPATFLEELEKVCTLYQYTQYDVLEKSLRIAAGETNIHSIDSTDTANVHISYDPNANKISYEFFDKKRNLYNFIFSVTYFLQEDFLAKISSNI